MKKTLLLTHTAAAMAFGTMAFAGGPVGTTFTYQGQLNQAGESVSGEVDLLFRLYDGPSGFNQIGATLFYEDFTVNEGVFTIDLDFGEGVFTGEPRWLEINIDGTTLNPRQPIMPAPYAIYAAGGNEGPPGDSHWSIAGSATYYTGGNVGIGTSSPSAPLHVQGSVIAGHSNNTATGENSFVSGGGFNEASGAQSFVGGGQSNEASGTSSFVGSGLQNEASGDGSFVGGGRLNEASGFLSFAAGYRAKAVHSGTFVWAANSIDEDFVSTAPHQFLIRADGGVGINTNDPSGFDLAVNGSAAKPGGGSWSSFSDERLKRDIQPITGMLDRLLMLNGYTFTFEDDAINNHLALPGTQIGLIAQEVAEVFPDWVDEDQDGFLFVTERGLTAIVVEALRDLREEKDVEFAAMQRELDELRSHNASLEARLAALEEAVAAMTQ